MSARTNWPYPRLFAHRGGGSFAPENTLAAMRTGHAMGFGAVEFDVQLTRDGISALLHDATLERTTNGQGRLADLTAAELSRLDAGGRYGGAFQGEPVPWLDTVAAFLQGKSMLANVEIKPPEGEEIRNGEEVARRCAHLWPQPAVPPLLSSFSIDALRAARAVAPLLPCALLADAPDTSHLALLEELDAVSLHCAHANIDADAVAWFHARGVRVLCYTVNEPERAAELFAIGVDGLFTDNLATMAKWFSP